MVALSSLLCGVLTNGKTFENDIHSSTVLRGDSEAESASDAVAINEQQQQQQQQQHSQSEGYSDFLKKLEAEVDESFGVDFGEEEADSTDWIELLEYEYDEGETEYKYEGSDVDKYESQEYYGTSGMVSETEELTGEENENENKDEKDKDGDEDENEDGDEDEDEDNNATRQLRAFPTSWSSTQTWKKYAKFRMKYDSKGTVIQEKVGELHFETQYTAYIKISKLVHTHVHTHIYIYILLYIHTHTYAHTYI